MMGDNGDSKKELGGVADHAEAQLKHWKRPKLEARMWHCGDPGYCDCYHPVVERITPGKKWPWIKRERLWEGTFHSQPETEEWKNQKAELAKAADDYKIILDSQHDWLYGWRYEDE